MPKTILQDLRDQLEDAHLLVAMRKLPRTELARIQGQIDALTKQPTAKQVRAKQAAFLSQVSK